MWDFIIVIGVVVAALIGLQFWSLSHMCDGMSDEERKKAVEDWLNSHPDCSGCHRYADDDEDE